MVVVTVLCVFAPCGGSGIGTVGETRSGPIGTWAWQSEQTIRMSAEMHTKTFRFVTVTYLEYGDLKDYRRIVTAGLHGGEFRMNSHPPIAAAISMNRK